MLRFAPLLIFFCLAFALMLALTQHTNDATQSAHGKETTLPLAPLDVVTSSGDAATLISRGNVMIVNFFASWCTPCIADHAELTALKATYPALEIHGIVWNDTRENIDAWLATHGNPFAHVWYDTKGKAAMTLGVRGMPESFIVDRKGIVRYHIAGPMNATQRETILPPLLQQWMAAP